MTTAPLAGTGGLAAAGSTLPPPPAPAQAAWERDAQPWAIAQERLRHVQALWQYGELVVFALLWHIEDLAAGLARRCPRCYDTGAASADDLISSAYGQGNQAACPVCYSTTLAAASGRAPIGLRARLVRPSLWADVDKDQRQQPKGVMHTAEAPMVETTPDFRVRTGDYLFRSTGERYYLRVPRRITLRTGFASSWQASAAISYSQVRASLEEATSPAYLIPPSNAQLAQVLGTYTRVPVDYSFFEVINGPLIPGEIPPPASYGAHQAPVTFPG